MVEGQNYSYYIDSSNFSGTLNSICESCEVKAWVETDVLEPARSDGGGEFLVACQGQLWQLELLGSFWGQLISYWGQ